MCTALYTDLGQGCKDMDQLGHANCVWDAFVQINASLNMYRARLQNCKRASWPGEPSLGQLFSVEADVATEHISEAQASL